MTDYGYVRVSTEEQSVDMQVRALTARGVTAIFADEGVSGATCAADRPELARLLAALRSGDTLTVYSLSRLGRSAVDVLRTLEDLEARGVALRSITESIDTRTPVGRLLISVLAAVAQFEREIIVERVRGGMAAARARGKHIGRPASIDARVWATLDAALARGESLNKAAKLAGVSYSHAHRYVTAKRKAG